MDYWLTYWYMFPTSIIIATLAMASSMEGGVLFMPTFVLLFPIVGSPTLSPAEAVGVSLITEVFGFSSGVLAYWRQRAIDLGTARFLLMFAMSTTGTVSYTKPILRCSLLNLQEWTASALFFDELFTDQINNV